MPNAGYTLRLDPWAAEYEGMIQLAEDDEPVAVDIRVESPAWTAIQPPAAPRPRRIAFGDGVRRIEHRLLIGEGERTVFGLLGSLGVGAVLVDGGPRRARDDPARGGGGGRARSRSLRGPRR